MTRYTLFTVGAVLFLLAFVGCPDATHASGTALFVVADLGGISGVTQLRFDGEADAGIVFADQVLPPAPSNPLSGKQSVRILLKDSWAGDTLQVSVEGLANGKPVADGANSVTVIQGVEVQVEVSLIPVSPGGSCGTSQCVPGQECINSACVCDSKSCPGGCCDGNNCIEPRTTEECGASGQSCGSCNPTAAVVADTCSANGTCLCGGTAPCGPGQRCQSQQCVCDSTSCPTGCCMGNICELGTQPGACGTGGIRCAACNGTQSCQNQQCLCDSNTCGGCCSGSNCERGNQNNACGRGGEACQVCNCNPAGQCH